MLSCINDEVTMLSSINDEVTMLSCINDEVTILSSINDEATMLSCINDEVTMLSCINHEVTMLNCINHEVTILSCINNEVKMLSCINHEVTMPSCINHEVTMPSCINHEVTMLSCINHQLPRHVISCKRLTIITTNVMETCSIDSSPESRNSIRTELFHNRTRISLQLEQRMGSRGKSGEINVNLFPTNATFRAQIKKYAVTVFTPHTLPYFRKMCKEECAGLTDIVPVNQITYTTGSDRTENKICDMSWVQSRSKSLAYFMMTNSWNSETYETICTSKWQF
jgi:hypothetical protein